MILPKKVANFFWGTWVTLFVLQGFDVLGRIPIKSIPTLLDVSVLLFSMVLFLYFVIDSIQKKELPKVLFVITPIFLIPIFSAISAKTNYGQPIMYGFLAERTKYLITLSVCFIFLLEQKKISLMLLENIVVKSAIVYLIIIYLLHIFVDPNLLESTDFVNVSPEKGAIFMMSKSLLLVLFFYSYTKCLDFKFSSIKYFVIIALILYALVFLFKTRAITIVAIAIIGAHLLLFTKVKYKLVLASSLVVLFVSVLVIVWIIGLEKFEEIFTLFFSAVNVYLGGEILDSSSLGRVLQYDIALDTFKEKMWLGNGFLSVNWNDGYKSYYKYFHPSDIGWLGLLHLYGILGFIILKLPLIYGLFFKQNWKKNNDHFFQAIRLTFYFIIVHGFFAGYEIKKLKFIAIVFGILYFYNYAPKKLLEE